jgi:hypothetical protein
MKKNYILLIFILFSLVAFSQQVAWLPGNGKVYGDKIQIKDQFNSDENLIENRFIGWEEGDIIQVPKYYFNGFESSDDFVDFVWDDNLIYIAQFKYPAIYAEKDINTIVISFVSLSGGTQTDTAKYYYSRPMLTGMLVNGQAFQDNMIVLNPEALTVKVKAYASMYNTPETQVDGDDYINRIHQVLDDTTILNITDTRNADIDIEVDISGLSFGLHELVLFAEGNKDKPSYPDEFSEKIRIRILKIDFAIQGDNDYDVCKCDSLYFLEGKPYAEGGVFSGDCVKESSNVFNPTLIQNQSTIITYSYPVDGTYYQVTRTISFHPLPEISLDVQTLAGIENEVCGFEHGTVYKLMGSGYSSSVWELPDYIIKRKYFLDDNTLVIDWAESGDGSVDITAISDKGCKANLEHLVHIKQSKAPEDSAYVTLYDRMLFCDTETNVYFWYKIDNNANEVFLAETGKPYYYLAVPPLPGESFFAWTATDTTSCQTHSHIYTLPLGGKSQNSMNDSRELAVGVFPNPGRDQVSCEFLRPVIDGFLTVSDIYGQKIDKIEFHEIYSGKILRLNTKDYKRGVYVLNFSMDGETGSVKLILY